jgi:predicted site-specific integrase-resolvase
MSKIYTPSEFAKKLGITTRTLCRWEAAGKLVAKRRPSGHLYYDEAFAYFQTMAHNNGCEIIIANQESLSPQQEMVEDLMAIAHTFSCRLYGLRKYQKVLKEALTQPKEHNESNTHSQ